MSIHQWESLNGPVDSGEVQMVVERSHESGCDH